MIARILVLLLIIIIMPTMYFDWRYWRKKKSFNWLKRVLLWLPTIAMVVYTIVLSTEKDFIPQRHHRPLLVSFSYWVCGPFQRPWQLFARSWVGYGAVLASRKGIMEIYLHSSCLSLASSL